MSGDGDVVSPAPLRVRDGRARDRVPHAHDAPEPSRRRVLRETSRRSRRRRRGEPRGSRLRCHPAPAPKRVRSVEETPSRAFHPRQRTQGGERADDGDGVGAPRVEHGPRPSTRAPRRRRGRLFAPTRRSNRDDEPFVVTFALDPARSVTRHRGRRLVDEFGRGVGGRDREFPSGDDVGDDGPIIVAPTTRASAAQTRVPRRALNAQIHRPLDALRAPPSPRRPRRDDTPRTQRGATRVRHRFVPFAPYVRERRREESALQTANARECSPPPDAIATPAQLAAGAQPERVTRGPILGVEARHDRASAADSLHDVGSPRLRHLSTEARLCPRREPSEGDDGVAPSASHVLRARLPRGEALAHGPSEDPGQYPGHRHETGVV
mmetsp:Transcript_1363/g.5344  ORF Transcript_1363/g.5344 Transcript_1363/m.5344 type:complete len:380 (-) Transcript_1363:2503-3642(-)